MHLDFQDFVARDGAVVHLVVSIIGIATAFILHKGEAVPVSRDNYKQDTLVPNLQSAGRSARGWNVAAHETSVSMIFH